MGKAATPAVACRGRQYRQTPCGPSGPGGFAQTGFDLFFLQHFRTRVFRTRSSFSGEADVHALNAVMYGTAGPDQSFQKQLSRAFFAWIASVVAHDMMPQRSPEEVRSACPIDLLETAETELGKLWDQYDAHWHKTWCTDIAQKHRRAHVVTVPGALAEAAQAMLDAGGPGGPNVTAENVMSSLDPDSAQRAEMRQVCMEYD